MRHAKAGRQLRRTSEQKLSLMRNLAQSLLAHAAQTPEKLDIAAMNRKNTRSA